jgi:phage terminase large subunit-like protein
MSLSPKKPKKSKKNRHDLPRLETIISDAVGSYGPNVVEWAATHLGVTMMPWQQHVLRQQLSYDKDARWCNRTALMSTARQQGKSVCIAATVGWFLTEYPNIVKRPVKIVTFAHRLDIAVSLFQDLAPVLEAKFGATPTWSYGRTEVTHKNSKWMVKAARPSAPHGLAGVDVLIGDELWGVDSDTLDIGFMPTQRAVPNPLAVFYSTAGTEQSVAMLRWREQGIRAIDTGDDVGIYFAEWSPPPDLDPMDSEAWAYANPALGHTISVQSLEAESHAPNRAAFLRSSVNLWIQTDQSWLPPGLFQELRAKSAPLPGGVMAVEVSMDDGRYVGVRCNVNADGQLTATVAFMVDTIAACWQAVDTVMQVNPQLVLAITPTLDVSCPTTLQHRRIIVGYQEICRWTAVVRQMLNEKRLYHTGETMLAEHVGRAVAVRTTGAIALSSTKSPGPIELARCLVWAAGISSRPAPAVRRAVVGTSKPRRVA